MFEAFLDSLKRDLGRELNEVLMFWIECQAACQEAAFVAVAYSGMLSRASGRSATRGSVPSGGANGI